MKLIAVLVRIIYGDYATQYNVICWCCIKRSNGLCTFPCGVTALGKFMHTFCEYNLSSSPF